MTEEYRNEALIRELEKEIEEKECGLSDCCWLFFCWVFGLVCIIPKYNARKLTHDRLVIELKKPKRPQEPLPQVQSIEDQRLQVQEQELRVLKEQQRLAELQQQSHFPPSYEYIGQKL